MRTSKLLASGGLTKMSYEALLDTLLEASADGCAAFVSAKRDQDGEPVLMVHVVDIKVADKEEVRNLVKMFAAVVANHHVFLGMAANA